MTANEIALVFKYFFSSNSHAKENENPKRNNKLHTEYEQKAEGFHAC